MNKNISKKIQKIYERLISRDGKKEEMYRNHYAVVIYKGNVMTKLCHNHYRVKVFGETRGTMHAEMSAITSFLNAYKSSFVNHSVMLKNFRDKRQCIL